MPAKQLQQYADRREFLYRTLYRAHRREVPGLTAFLTEARAAGFRLALGTGSGEETIAYILDHLKLRHFFEVIIGEEDVRRGKPHPATYLKAAAKLGVAPADCVVFEDAILGEQAAHRAGMRCIGMATTLRAADFQQPLAVINDFRELSVARLRALLA